jgi:pimeloyl-ACP methyl ester carboxylesterase
MAAAGSDRAALLTFSEACAVSLLFAATFPERVTALVVYGGWARFFADSTYAPGVPREFWEPILTGIRDGWGTAAILPLVAPSAADDPRLRSWWGEWERLSASPGTAVSQAAVAMELDIRDVLLT